MQIKTVSVLAVATLLLSGVLTQAATKPSADIAAVVNGQKITINELKDVSYKWMAPTVLRDLIMVHLVDAEAKKAGVVITDKQITDRISEAQLRLGRKDMPMDDFIASSGQTVAHARAGVRMDLQTMAILRKNVKVTADDLDGFRKMKQILLRAPRTPGYPMSKPDKSKTEQEKEAAAADKAIQEKMDKIYVEIQSGLSFEDAAKKYSEDPTTKDKGGDTGWIRKLAMPPEFEKAAYALKPGEISKPIKTGFGYYILKCVAAGKDVQGAELADLREQFIQRSVDAAGWLKGLMDKAKIESSILPKTSPAGAMPGQRPGAQGRPSMMPGGRGGAQMNNVPNGGAPTPSRVPGGNAPTPGTVPGGNASPSSGNVPGGSTPNMGSTPGQNVPPPPPPPHQ